MTAVALVLGLVACGRGGVEVVEDDQLGQAMRIAYDSEEPRPLREITGGDWDQVQVFHAEAATRDRIERTLGETVDMPESFFLSKDMVLFFKKGGKVVRAVKVEPVLFGEGLHGAGLLVGGRR